MPATAIDEYKKHAERNWQLGRDSLLKFLKRSPAYR